MVAVSEGFALRHPPTRKLPLGGQAETSWRARDSRIRSGMWSRMAMTIRRRSFHVHSVTLAFAALTLGVGLAPNAQAQTTSNSAAAQALFEQARTLMAQGRPAEACPKLEESQRLDPGSGTLLNLARCYEQAGRLASAWNQYLEAASAARSAGNKERESEARKRAEALR